MSAAWYGFIRLYGFAVMRRLLLLKPTTDNLKPITDNRKTV